jgi:hypothetical protein
VKNDYGTEQEAWALNGLEEPLIEKEKVLRSMKKFTKQ